MLCIPFEHDLATDHDQVGGKGANLGLLSKAGFSVPPGFTVAVDAYRSFISSSEVAATLSDRLAAFDYDNADRLEAQTADLRQAIIDAPVPAEIREAIVAAYAELGTDGFVAVRSSGTAEDMAGASFGGLHDTILGVTGAEEVIVAVKECWASMWSARATSYRQTRGFDSGTVGIAVVVQRLVDSDVAGVLFTGNPMTAASDEYMINANWGLGESVVAGIVTPDQFLIRSGDFGARERTLGTKQLRIVRDPERGQRTFSQDTAAEDRERFSLTDAELAELGALGRAVTEHYDHIPQDIEWAFAGGRLYLLQSRPITGVDFSWDELVDGWQTAPDSDEYVWSRAWADQVWTGAITPLSYSWRAMVYTKLHANAHTLWGDESTAGLRLFKYHKAEAYENAEIERQMMLRAHPAARVGTMGHVPPTWHEEIGAAGFSFVDYVKTHARIVMLQPKAGFNRWVKDQYTDYIHNDEQKALTQRASDEDLAGMSDPELKAYIDEMIEFERRYFQDMWSGFFLHARDSMTLLGVILAAWYDGENAMVFNDLITGVPKLTFTMKENYELWDLALEIRRDPGLRELFDRHEGASFFHALDESEAGRAFLVRYHAFLDEYGHRGQADRDLYFPRRVEDLSVDYGSLRALLSAGEDADPRAREHETNAKRAVVVAEVVDNIRSKPLGGLKVEAFKVVYEYVQQFLMYRDNERHFTDRVTWAGKRGFLELSRRLRDRGLLHDPREYLLLTRDELFELFDGQANLTWTRAKIAGRSANFSAFLAREYAPPMYLQAGQVVSFGEEDTDPSNLHGLGTSRGNVTGIARIVGSLTDVGRLKEGEILVTNATDPGWTPVFMIISGIVLETGGALAHGSCLAREYGLPAVQLPDAMRRIPDGATITIDGATGEIHVQDDPSSVEASDPAPELTPA